MQTTTIMIAPHTKVRAPHVCTTGYNQSSSKIGNVNIGLGLIDLIDLIGYVSLSQSSPRGILSTKR
jgi:hypothetical protein